MKAPKLFGNNSRSPRQPPKNLYPLLSLFISFKQNNFINLQPATWRSHFPHKNTYILHQLNHQRIILPIFAVRIGYAMIEQTENRLSVAEAQNICLRNNIPFYTYRLPGSREVVFGAQLSNDTRIFKGFEKHRGEKGLLSRPSITPLGVSPSSSRPIFHSRTT